MPNIEMREVNVRLERFHLFTMDGEIFSPADRFDDWSPYVVHWIEMNGSPVGCFALHPNMAPGPRFDIDVPAPCTLWLVTIGIRPPFRRQGIATIAMQWVIDLAGHYGFHRLVSNFRVGNTASRQLHYRCGFTNSKINPAYYRDPSEDAQIVEIPMR